MVPENTSGPVDCACVIHGTGYDWIYVDRLYSMLSRHISAGVKLHVYTEADRTVPEPYVKHSLIDWKISGPKKSWWYKMQIFNAEHHTGPLLYFDLDTVIVNNLDWLVNLSPEYFWTVRDFKYLWKPDNYTINSSIMWFDTRRFHSIWQDFSDKKLEQITVKYRGDQDYITEVVPTTKRRFFDLERVKSWRWQCLDGGYIFTQKRHILPNTGTAITPLTSVLIFHGNPKPDKIVDPVISQHWQ